MANAATILQEHLAKARAGGDKALAATLTDLIPLASNPKQLVAEVYQRYSAIDRQQYAMAKSDVPRTPEFMREFDMLGDRFRELHSLERALKA